MEQLNRIELIGKVGGVRTNTFGDRSVANFQVVTNCTYSSKDGQPIVESTWHQVTAWSGKAIENPTQIATGMTVHVVGRLRSYSYAGADGNKRSGLEVIANSVRILEEEATVQTL